jgi:hypothetical protein
MPHRPRLGRPAPATVISIMALVVALSGTAYAATGGNLILGHANTAANPTSLTQTGTTGAALSLTNNAAAPALRLNTPSTAAPLAVSSSVRVANLNADLLDGVHAAALQSQVVAAGAEAGPANGAALVTATVPAQGPFLIAFTGSAYRDDVAGAGPTSLAVLECQGIVSSCTLSTPGATGVISSYAFTNQTNSHTTSTAVTAVTNLPFTGPSTFSVIPTPGVAETTDSNDELTLTILKVG